MEQLLPTLASEHGAKIDQLLLLEHALILAVVGGWLLYFVYVLCRFRRKRQPVANHEGARSHRAHVVEVIVFGAEVGLLVLLSIPFFTRQVTALPGPGPEELRVRAVAQQYQWNIHYPGPDGIFSAARLDLVDDVNNPLGLDHDDPYLVDDVNNPLGLDHDDPYGKDDIVKRGQLVLPVGKSVTIYLSSKDVVHSFALPEFRVKQDAIPGMVIPVRFTPTMTTEAFQRIKKNPQRQFEIVCAQLCGQGHFSMRGVVEVLTPQAFEAWLKENAPAADSQEYDSFFE
ncbi:MAG: cytochrome c oxidase subunit II [Candidatus Hydrogenedentes bacterium]|nr:cytochrome c oxidase subunit II [Candidatus Hydrogenedentota bacterium]